jgi:hypothetical protein
MSWRLGGIEQRLTCPHVSDVVHAQMWVLEQVADLVIDLERPVIVKEIGIKPLHSHPNIVLQLTTDDYRSCLLVVPFLTQACSVSGIAVNQTGLRTALRVRSSGPPPWSGEQTALPGRGGAANWSRRRFVGGGRRGQLPSRTARPDRRRLSR